MKTIQDSSIFIGRYLVIFSGIYMSFAPLGFPHIFFLLSVLYYSIFILPMTPDLTVNRLCWLLYGIIFSLCMLQIFANGNFKGTVNFISSFLFFCFTVELLSNASLAKLKKIALTFIKFSTFVLTVECFVRICMSIIKNRGAIGLYSFKEDGVMFLDTNFTGLFIIVLLFLSQYLKIFHSQKTNRYIFILIILCVLTFSRAAILATIIGLIFFSNIKNNRFISKIKQRTVLLFIISGIIGIYIYNLLYEDASFRTKVQIVDIFFNSLDYIQNKYAFLIGMGLGNSKEFLNIYAHNIFLLYFLEIGLIGLILWLFTIALILIKTNWKGLIILFPFLIAAQSAVSYGTHYLYATLALIYLLNNKLKTENEQNNIFCNK
jgi:O-antigen ligase